MDTLTLTETALAGTFATVSVAGEEALNDLFDFRVALLMPPQEHALQGGAEALERVLLGARAWIELGEGPARQRRAGIVSEARYEGILVTDDGPMARVSLRVVPTAWLLTQRRKSRIFQKMYPHEIVSRVLAEAGVRHRWSLDNRYPRRIYCTQYDETDWAFVSRLLAEEGVLFFFEHPSAFAPAVTASAADDETRADAAAGIGAIGTIAHKFGEAAGIGAASLGGQALQIVGDLIAAPEADEEDPLSKRGGEGAAGPHGAGDVLVFIDHAKFYARGAHDDEPGAQPLGVWRRHEADMAAGDHYVATAFGPHGAVRPDQVENRDYDFRRPLMLLRATQGAGKDLRVDGEARPLEVYAHHGEYETPDVTVENARNTLDQHRARATVFRGESVCPRLLPGVAFEMHNGTSEPMQEGRFVPVRVVHHAINPKALGEGARSPAEAMARSVALAIHQALRPHDPARGDDAWTETELHALIRHTAGAFRDEQPVPYRCVFECVRDDVPARPHAQRREVRNVVETATVVGPRGDDIYTDRFGRVKVQFHWDRSGRWDEQSSCWVRVAQAAAGAGFGFQFIPRVGMEVLVSFVRGDPDRPVIVGTLYNGIHETPDPLPLRKTRSAIRTQSSPEGGGYNELAFEDQLGLERVILRSQKDLELFANDHHARTVRGGETVTVGATQTVTVGEEQRTGVRDNQSTLVGGSQSASVRGNRAAFVAHDEATYVDGGRVDHVRGSTGSVVEGDVTLGLNGSRLAAIKGDDRVIVGTDEAAPRLHHTRVVGTALTVAHKVQLHAEVSDRDGDRGIHLRCGDSTITMTKDAITIRSKHVSIQGTERVMAIGKDATLTLDDAGITGAASPVTFSTGQGASLVLDKASASLLGSRIRLQPEPNMLVRSSPEAHTDAPNVKLRFTHDRLGKKTATPLANVRARVSSVLFTGTATSDDGVLEVYAQDAVRTFTVQLFAHERYPELYTAAEEPLTFLVKLEDDVPAANLPAGARFRLRNLGYEPGPDLRAAALDPSTEEALVEYQFDRDKARTGALDAVTVTDLRDTWGD